MDEIATKQRKIVIKLLNESESNGTLSITVYIYLAT